jgi:hypothetical protein
VKRRLLEDFTIALSMANLLFLPVWKRLLSSGFFAPSYVAADYLASIVAVISIGLVLLGVLRAGSTSVRFRIVRRWTIILGLIAVANHFRNFLPAFSLSALSNRFGATATAVLAVTTVVFITLGMVFRNQWISETAEKVFLVLFPFAIVALLSAGWRAAETAETALAHTSTVKRFEARAKPRVLWMVFDELDERATFVNRPGDLRLPALDRLRAEAISASQAYPPGSETLLSVSSLLLGKRVRRCTPEGVSQLSIMFEGAARATLWSNEPNIFQRAAELGVRSAVVGWYMPYCRMLKNDLASCSWYPYQTFPPAANSSLGARMVGQIGSLTPWSIRYDHLRSFRAIMADAERAATDVTLDLVFVHWPVPHDPPIYDRFSQEFVVFRLRHLDDWYPDNLALVDRALGELRTAMEKSRTWEKTTVVVTSDHSLRSFRTFGGRRDPRVPLLIKLAGDKQPVQYQDHLETILIHDLILAVFRGELKEPEEVIHWFDERRPPPTKEISSTITKQLPISNSGLGVSRHPLFIPRSAIVSMLNVGGQSASPGAPWTGRVSPDHPAKGSWFPFSTVITTIADCQ